MAKVQGTFRKLNEWERYWLKYYADKAFMQMLQGSLTAPLCDKYLSELQAYCKALRLSITFFSKLKRLMIYQKGKTVYWIEYDEQEKEYVSAYEFIGNAFTNQKDFREGQIELF